MERSSCLEYETAPLPIFAEDYRPNGAIGGLQDGRFPQFRLTNLQRQGTHRPALLLNQPLDFDHPNSK